MNDAGAPSKWIGQSVERLEDPPLVTGRGALCRRHQFRAPASHAGGALQPRARQHPVDLHRLGARPAGRGRGVDRRRHRRRPADRFPRRARSRSSPPTASRCWRSTRCAMSASRSRWCSPRTPTSPRTPPTSSPWRSRSLPPLLDARDEPGEFSFARDTEATVLHQGYGDVEAVFKSAPHIVELKLTSGRHSGVPLETRGAIGRYDASRDVLELHGAAKVPHRNKELIARMLNRAPSSVQCFESHVGGGFGIRGEIYPEDILVCVAAMRFERPVKWIEDRREHLIAANHSRHQHHHIKAAVTDDGEILAIDDVIHHDNGAYVRTHATRVAMMTCGVLPGPYRVPGAYRAVCHFRLTNKTPAATYRAPGRFETTFVRERLVDAIAHQLRLDPIHVRRRNAVTVAEMPFKRPLEALGEEIHFDSGDYHALLDTTLKHVEWTKLNEDLAARRENGEMVGVGLAMFVEKAGLGPGRRRAHPGRYVGRGRGDHRRRVDRAGVRDRDGAGRRRVPRHRLQEDARHPRPDRPHRAGHRRARLARHGDDRVGDARRGAQGAREGAEHGGRADAVAGRHARHRRRRGGDRRPQGRSVDPARQDRGGARAKLQAARRPRAGAVRRRLVLRRPPGLSLRQPSRGGEGRSRHRLREGAALRRRL